VPANSRAALASAPRSAFSPHAEAIPSNDATAAPDDAANRTLPTLLRRRPTCSVPAPSTGDALSVRRTPPRPATCAPPPHAASPRPSRCIRNGGVSTRVQWPAHAGVHADDPSASGTTSWAYCTEMDTLQKCINPPRAGPCRLVSASAGRCGSSLLAGTFRHWAARDDTGRKSLQVAYGSGGWGFDSLRALQMRPARPSCRRAQRRRDPARVPVARRRTGLDDHGARVEIVIRWALAMSQLDRDAVLGQRPADVWTPCPRKCLPETRAW
jgi:hypothetical protein